MSLDGPISVRLRLLYGPSVGDWPAYRAPEEIHDMPPESYLGISLSDISYLAPAPIREDQT